MAGEDVQRLRSDIVRYSGNGRDARAPGRR